MSEATTVPTEPQPQPTLKYFCIGMSFKPIFELLQIDLLGPHAVILFILDNSF